MKFEEQGNKGISELLAPVKIALQRHIGLAWAPALAVFLLVLGLSFRLPDYFAADALIFIQPQKISSKIVEAPEKEEQQERLEALIHEVISRPRRLAIIDQFGLYPRLRGIKGREKALKRFHKAMNLEPVKSFSGKELVQTFRIEFAHHNPKTAFEVTKALSSLFIEESIISQRSEAQGTVEFLEAQLRKAKKRLEETEEDVQKFIRENFGRLPEHLDQAIQRLQSARQQYSTNSQLISANSARLSYLQRELQLTAKETSLAAGAGAAVESADPRAALGQLERALSILQSKYSERHPDVIATKERIRLLKQRIGKTGGGSGKVLSGSGGREVRTLRREISELNVQTEAMRKENTIIKERIAKLEEDISAMPLKEQELIKIKRDYNSVSKEYQKLNSALEEARMQESLIRGQRGTQFRLVNPPALPVIPSGPQRLIIAGVGLFVSLAMLVGIPMALYFLNDSFKSRDDFEDDLGLEVLGIIPPMSTPTAKANERRANSTSMLASVVAFVAGGVLILLAV